MKTQRLLLASLAAIALPLMPDTSPAANEIGFIETFALAENRESALAQLIPGTEDHYFFHCLHHQAQGDLAAANSLLAPWVKRHGETPRFREIRNRQALLGYEANPKASLDYLIHQLGLRFDHQKEELNKKPALPTTIDPKQITTAAFRSRAFSHHKNLSGVEDRGLDALLREGVQLDTTRRRDLLARLTRPDFPKLVALIAADLKTKESRGFGEFNIHRALLPAQLDELLKLQPELIRNVNYINTVITKKQPSADIDWANDPDEKAAHLARVWAFVQDLDPAFNALKTHALYQILADNRNRGNFDKKLFMRYLQLPRRAGYVEPKYLEDPDRRRTIADLNSDFRALTACSPIGNDESLVREYLLHLFKTEADFKPYTVYIRENWIKPIFAEAKILAGAGDQEKWYSMLSPSAYEALKERVDIDFVPWNPRTFTAADTVSLELDVKNVRELIVKVYQINTLNYYLQEGREVNTDLQLDGLVANSEKRHEYKEPALRRVRHSFDFPELEGKRGVWVIEFIGNGRSSRALVRKGALQYLSRTTPAGTAFTILDADNKPVAAPALWVGGRPFTPEKDGQIIVPFSTSPGRQAVILGDGAFTALDSAHLPGESYNLSAGFHVEAETLLPGHRTQVTVRPALTVSGTPTTLALLDKATLTITSTDHDGISSTLEVPNFKLAEDRESTHEFRVPERLHTLHVSLNGQIENVSTGAIQPVSAGASFEVNGIDRSEHIWTAHLAKLGGNYVLELLGKTGEPKVDVPLRIHAKHEDYKQPYAVTLKSAESGQIGLGALDGISWIAADGPGGQQKWYVDSDYVRLPGSLHGLTGTALSIPYAGSAAKVSPSAFSLLEKRGGTYTADHLQALSLSGGFLKIAGLPAGDFELVLKEQSLALSVRITEGQVKGGYALGKHRHLQTKRGTDLQVVSVTPGKEKTAIKLAGANPFTRVHVIATRYQPRFSLPGQLGGFPYAEPLVVRRGHSTSRFLSGRDIGDEYRYIIERRGALKFPGNMLTRPGLLLNPWEVRETDTATDRAKDGSQWAAAAADKQAKRAPGAVATPPPAKPKARNGRSGAPFSPSLDFLAEAAPAIFNLVPDKNGVVSIDTADLGDRQFLQVLAVDPQNTAYRQLSLPDRGTATRDLRLAAGLEPDGHFSEQKQATVLAKDQALNIADVRTAKVETYEDLSKVYNYFAALRPDETLAEFRFLIDWPELDAETKLAKYSKYACHELHFFVSRRDPEFFKAVVLPYLTNKRDKTFMDHYLLGAELSSYLEPWRFGRLNAVERILLASRIAGDEPGATARHLRDIIDLQPRDIARENHLFETAVKGLALSAEGGAAATVDMIREEALMEREESEGLRRLGGKAGAFMDAKESAAEPSADPFAAADGAVALRARKSRGAELKKKYNKEARTVEKLDELKSELGDFDNGGAERASGRYAYFGKRQEVAKRTQQARLFRQLAKTKEYAENNYYQLPIGQQNAALISANPFWIDFAEHVAAGGNKPFLSTEFGHAARNFTEAALALAVLDLPFEGAVPETVAGADKAKDKNPLGVTITAGGPTIVFHREIKSAPISDERSPLLVAQNHFRHGDRYKTVAGERYDKFVRGEFLSGVVYGSQIAITNPTSTRQKIDLLAQIPSGAIPAAGARYTGGQHLSIDPYATVTNEYHFYFPAASAQGKPFGGFPAHAAKNEEIVAWAAAVKFNVVDQATEIDKSSWDYISQHADAKAVLDFLEQNNPRGIDLNRIAWRMRDAGFFKQTLALLEKRHVYHNTLYSYGVHHNAVAPARQFIAHQDGFVNACGAHLQSALLDIDLVERHRYEHLEYAPLVNARAHPLGKDRKILNSVFRGQYQRFLNILAYKTNLSDEDRLGVTYYLFLQDRVDEALSWFAGIDASAVAEKLQHDYMRCYVAFYQGQAAAAKKIAAAHAEHPVIRWRNRFEEVIAQADQIAGGKGIAEPAAPEGEEPPEDAREREHEAIAKGEPSIGVEVEGGAVALSYRNVSEAVVNYYRMDLEFLFSTKPFLSGDSARFSIIKPNLSTKLKLPKGKDAHRFELPAEFAGQNVMVEVVAAGRRAAQPYFANTLDVTLVENYGIVEVREAGTGNAVPRAYVKVYARGGNGQTVFFKDGYTDLRGKFDYASLSTDDLDGASRFAILIMSEKNGALVKEANPPLR